MQAFIINKAAGGNATIGIGCNVLIEATGHTDQELFPKSSSTTGTTSPTDASRFSKAILFWLPGELLARTHILSLST